MIKKRNICIFIMAFLLLFSFILPTTAKVDEALNKKILIMGDQGYAPYEYIDKYGNPNGYNVELITALMEELGLDYEIRLGEWREVIRKFKNGEIDIITGLSNMPERNLPALYSIPTDYTYNYIVVRDDSNIETYEDLAGKEIIVQVGDKMDEYFKAHPISDKIIRVANTDEGMQILVSGKHDAAVYPQKVAANLMARNSEYRRLRLIPIDLKGIEYSIAINQNNLELLKAVDEGLLRLKEKGIYDKIHNKWFHSRTITPEQERYIIAIIIFLALLIVLILFVASLKMRIKSKALKKINESLSMSLQKYNAIFDSMIIGVEFYNKEGILVDMNLKAIELYGATGYTKAQILANNISCHDNLNLTDFEIDNVLAGNPYEGILKYDFDLAQKSRCYKTTNVGIREFDTKISPIYDYKHEMHGFIVLLTDVTVVKNYQRELEESNLKTELAIRISNMVQWEYDVEKRIFFTINERWISNFLTVEDYYNVTHPDDLQEVKDVIGLMDSRRNEVFQFDVRFKFPTDNEWQYITISGTPLKQNKNGDVTNYTGFQRNNTQWHSLTEELKDKNELNKLILSNMHSGLVYIDTNRQVVWENTSDKFSIDFTNGRKLFEVGKSCCDTLWEKDELNKKSLFDETYSKMGSQTIEKAFENGNVLEIVGNPIIDESGSITGTILRVDDVTERKRLHNELEISTYKAVSTSQLLSAILNRIPGALFIKDPNDDFKYIIANKVFCETLGKSESEIIGKTDFDIMELEKAKKSREEDKMVLTINTPMITEDVAVFNEKSYCWQTIKSSFTYTDNRQLIIVMSMDISELKKANNELRKAMIKAEESDKLKSAFLANMSHEIRTPLNAIVGFSELLKNCTDDEEKEEYMNIIATNNELLLRLINDILDLSKLESGIVQFHNTEFDLSQYFKELSMTMRQRITNPNIEFITVNPYKSCVLKTDKDKLTQVWLNFLTNAIKYTASGYIKMGYEYVNGGIKIYVEDTGIGIPDHKKDKIFQRFEKLDSFAQGTGLGLSICKAIAELDGGEVGFESTEGKGSYFWAWKPAQVVISNIESENYILGFGDDEIDQSEIYSYLQRNCNKILVAEDNESNFLLVSYILKDNFELIHAKNGAEAIDVLKNNSVDLILMDMKMPVMDGLTATRIIREFNNKIPIIALTANAFNSDRTEALKAGCNEFLTKPIRKKILLQAMFKAYIS